MKVLLLGVEVEIVDEVEGELLRGCSRLLTEQRALEECLRHLLRRSRHGDRHPEITLDGLVLADEDIEDHTVDRVVGPVVGNDPDLASTLTETVHPSLALLVARRIPRQVVVQHRVEVLLQVDAFRQAVGADQHEQTAAIDENVDTRFTFSRREVASDRFHSDIPRQLLAQVARDVLRSVDESAEDDGMETILEKRP